MTDLEEHDGTPDELDRSGFSFSGLTAFGSPAADAAAFDFAPGTRLGDATLIRLVGEGGMGRVYEGLQGMPCRTVAVKVIHPGVLSPVAIRRFEHEAQILGRLTHPGIAHIYSAGVEQIAGRAVPFLVMEYLDAALPLTAYATSHGLSVAERLALFREVCLAVGHGHSKGIVHRDLKPGNILVDAAGRPKIIDFGVARCTDHDTGLTTLHTAGSLVGTLKYMAPEQFDGGAGIDARADVYSLGVLLFELLTGRLPYAVTGHSVYEAARTVTDVDPQPLSACGREFRGDLDTIVATCLEKDRSRRYQSAADLEADLGRHLRGEAIAARPPRLLDGVIRLARRHRAAAIATAGMVAAVAIGLVGITIFAVRAESARQDAVRQAREAAREREAADRERGRADTEAATARQQLYVANLQALQSCLDSKNLRLARQLHAENSRLVGEPLPLELRCFAEPMDEAAVVIAPNLGPIARLEYAPDGSRLAAAAFPPAEKILPHRRGVVMKNFPYFTLPRDLLLSTKPSPFVFSHAAHLRYDRVSSDEPGWMPRWMLADARQPHRTAGSGKATQPLAISPDGGWLVLPANGGQLRIVNATTGEEQTILEERHRQLRRVELAAGGHRLAAVGTNGVLRLWDVDAATELATVGGAGLDVASVCFSPDGSRLVAVAHLSPRAPVIVILDAADGRRRATVPLARHQFHGDHLVAFSTDGRWVVGSSDEPELHVWNADDGSPVATLEGHAAAVRAVAFSVDGSRLATGAANGHVRLWNTGSWSLEHEFMGHVDAVAALAFSPDGLAIASGSLDGTLRIWPATGQRQLAVLPDVNGLAAVAFRPDGLQLAIAARGSGAVELWDPLTVERLQTLDGPGGTVTHLAWSADGSTIAAAFFDGSQPGSVRAWNAATASPQATLPGHEQGATSVAFSPDGRRLLTTSRAGAAITWELSTGRELMNAFPSPIGPYATKTAAFGLDGTRVICRSRCILDASTGDTAAPLPPQGQVSCVAASPDGGMAAMGFAMGSTDLIDVATGSRHAKLVGHTSTIRAIGFSPAGTEMATGSLDGTIRLWAVPGGALLHVLDGHEGFVDAVLYTPDGRRVVTAANDGTVRIWDTASGRQLVSLPGQRETAGAIAIAPDGAHLVTADPEGAVRIWGLSNATITAARAAADAPPRLAGPGAAAAVTGRR